MIDRIRMHKALDWVIDSCSGGRAAMDGLDWPPKWHGFAYHADALEPGKTPPGVKYSMLYLGGIERKATGKFEGFTNYPTKISEVFNTANEARQFVERKTASYVSQLKPPRS